MNGWRTAKLSEVAELNPRLAERLDGDTVVSFVPMSAVTAETASTTSVEARRFSEVSKGYKPFHNGDVLVAKITPCFENGKIAQATLAHPVGFGSTEFHVIRPRAGESDARYLLHYLRQERIKRDGERKMTGSAGQRRVPEYFLTGLDVPLPSVPEQRRIADVLDRADGLRAARRAALAHLDDLTQAIFLDLFGDPASNPKKLPVRRIGDLLSSASYGTSAKAGPEGAFPVLRMNNITRSGEMELTDLKYMDLGPSEVDRFTVRAGDLLFNRTNSADLVGKTALYRRSEPMAYAGYLVRLRVNAENHPEYLAAFLNTPYAKRVLRGMCKSIIGMANINATEVQGMKTLAPPLSLQQEFARRVEKVEQLRSAHRDSLAKMDELFAAMQHRAFRGEL